MKIKFLKPFRLYNPIGEDMTMDEGTVENMEIEDNPNIVWKDENEHDN